LSPHFGRHGSTAIMVSGAKAGMWHDHEACASGDMLALIMRERGGGFLEAVRFAEQFVGHTPSRPVVSLSTSTDAERNTRLAVDIWQHAVPIAGTIAARYLAGRGIFALPAGVDGDALRFHPSCPYDGGRQPCMVALLRVIAGDEPRAIQRTALTAAATKIGRRTLGPKAGAAIKLSGDADVANRLTVGEGCETVLSGMMIGYSPAWALGDAGELGRFPVLAGIESITILTDHDAAGAGAAMACSARWTGAGRDVFRVVPRQPGADVNDIMRLHVGTV
jgi:hypothetical protein